MYNVIGTETYVKELDKWTKTDREAAFKIHVKLTENPFVGDPLGFEFFREKRVQEKRIYFLVYKELNLVLMVATSGKKNQQATIDYVKLNLDQFRIIAEKIAKQAS